MTLWPAIESTSIQPPACFGPHMTIYLPSRLSAGLVFAERPAGAMLRDLLLPVRAMNRVMVLPEARMRETSEQAATKRRGVHEVCGDARVTPLAGLAAPCAKPPRACGDSRVALEKPRVFE